jgi:CelD/BcsL family acetyltransferase involved in cellulose biosynthesis
MNIKLVSSQKEFSALRTEWNKLLQRSRSNSIFLTWEMLYYWWENFCSKDNLYILLASKGEELAGIAPLYIKGEKRGISKYKVLRILSDQYYSSRELDFICKQGHEQECYTAFWDYLSKNKQDWDLIYLFGILSDTVNYRFWNKLIQAKAILYNDTRGKYSLVDLSDWEGYLKDLKPRMRTKARSAIKRFAELKAQCKIEFVISNNEGELPRQLDSFISLHQKRWHKDKKQGMFDVPGYEKYFREVLPQLLLEDWLLFTHLKYGNKYIAHQLCLKYRGVVHLINEGFDTAIKDFNPGNMLRAKTFKYLHEQSIKTYDFLNNISQHKLNWGAQVNFQYNLEIGHKSLKNKIYFSKEKIISSTKKVTKRAIKR